MVLNFSRDWIAYREGFGDPEAEYWIGTIIFGLKYKQCMKVIYHVYDGLCWLIPELAVKT